MSVTARAGGSKRPFHMVAARIFVTELTGGRPPVKVNSVKDPAAMWVSYSLSLSTRETSCTHMGLPSPTLETLIKVLASRASQRPLWESHPVGRGRRIWGEGGQGSGIRSRELATYGQSSRRTIGFQNLGESVRSLTFTRRRRRRLPPNLPPSPDLTCGNPEPAAHQPVTATGSHSWVPGLMAAQE